MPNLMSVLAVGFGGWAGWRGAEREPPRSLPVDDMVDDMVDGGGEEEEEGEDCEVGGLELGRAVDACWACGVCAQFGSRAGVALLADCHR